jgi:hypothetical protein
MFTHLLPNPEKNMLSVCRRLMFVSFFLYL